MSQEERHIKARKVMDFVDLNAVGIPFIYGGEDVKKYVEMILKQNSLSS